MNALVVIDGVRTPFCKAGTTLAGLGAADLGRIAVTALLARTGIDPEIVDEVIFGCVGQPADSANVARVIALRSGLPERIPAVSVHRNCASGMEAVTSAVEKLAAGHGEVFIVGGTESMSHLPLLFPKGTGAKFARLARGRGLAARLGASLKFRPADFKPVPALRLALVDPVAGMNMGETAELLAREHHISRQDQDRFALRSHQRAELGKESLAQEIAPVHLDDGTAVTADNGVRPDSTLEKLAKLAPAFLNHGCGTVTAGNSSQITDGAVALLVMSASRAQALGLEPLGRIERYAYAGCDPRRMGLGPVNAIEKAGRPVGDADVVELNEAFAAQSLAVLQELGGVAEEKLNPNGGAIALGHPVGASGARLILTCLKELKRRKANTGLATLCVGGGQGGAVWLERISS
ncbi:MAG: thiolase family protein [Verrucomicrobiales bacterium]